MLSRIQSIDFILYEADAVALANAQPLEDDIQIVACSPASPSGVEAIDQRLSDTHHCYAVFQDEKVVHESWLFFDLVLPMQFGFDPAVPVIGECATTKSHRGLRLYPKTLRYAVKDVLERGICERVFLWVAPENAASIHGVERAGFRRLGRLRGRKYGGIVFAKRIDP